MKKIYEAIDEYPITQIVLVVGFSALLSELLSHNTLRIVIHTSIAILLSFSISDLTKRLVKKPRKKYTRKTKNTYSFPSNHASVAFASASVVSYYFPAVSAFMFGAALFISYSRTKLKVHDWYDVITGAIIGISSSIAVLVVV